MIVGVAGGVLLCAGCGSDDPNGISAGHTAALEVSFPKSSLAEQITEVRLRVEMETELVYQDSALVQGGEFHFADFELPAGEAFFMLRALGSPGDTLYSGDTTATIAGGVETRIIIELQPAVPMVKLSPYFAEVPVGARFLSTIELFNINKFFNGSFRVVYDPEVVAFDDTIRGADPAWGDLIGFAEDLGDTVVLSVSRTRGNTDTVPDDVHALVNLQFRLLESTSGTELKIIIHRLEQFDEAIDISEIYTDHQTISSAVGADSIPPLIITDPPVSNLSVLGQGTDNQ
jgi:hypothetical protein